METGERLFVVDLKSNAPFIDQDSVKRDYDIFHLEPGDPGQLVVGVIVNPTGELGKGTEDEIAKSRQQSIVGVFSCSHRVHKNDPIGSKLVEEDPLYRYRPPISPHDKVTRVNKALHGTLFLPAAEKAHGIVSATGRSIRELWDAEADASISAPATPAKGVAAVKELGRTEGTHAIIGTASLEESAPFSRGMFAANRYDESSSVEEFLGLKIETNDTPTLNLQGLEGRVIEDATQVAGQAIGEAPSYSEMEAHVINVSHAEFVRNGDEVVAFGTSRHYDGYINSKGRREKLTILWGTMVDPQYRRLGLMIKLNYDLILSAKQACRNAVRGAFKSIRRMFIPAPMVVRTQSRAVWEACNRHFEGVVPVGEMPKQRYQHMISYTALREGWVLDELNVQRDAYSSTRVNNEKDLIPGLSPHDAVVISGDFTFWRETLTKFYISFIYPWRAAKKAPPQLPQA
jgi:hypothetical protein